MVLPKLTARQILVIETLMTGGWISGKKIRAALEKLLASTARQSFYGMMGTLEKNGYVDGKYEEVDVAEFSLRQRFYRITDHGRGTHQEVLEFWKERQRQHNLTHTKLESQENNST